MYCVNLQKAITAIEWTHQCSASRPLRRLYQTLHWECMYCRHVVRQETMKCH